MSELPIIWTEKYRPTVLSDCILPKSISDSLNSFIQTTTHPHLIFAGKSGVGKTTAAKCLANQLGAESLVINASLDRNIDTLRLTITDFASSHSVFSDKKIIILDEADYLNPNSFQPALRNFMEEYSSNVQFILTCNQLSGIIDPLISRCSVIKFDISQQETQKIKGKICKRLSTILQNESVEFVPSVLVDVVNHYFPDIRKMLNVLQQSVVDHQLISEKLFNKAEEQKDLDKLFNFVKNKNFKQIREWALNKTDFDFKRNFIPTIQYFINHTSNNNTIGLMILTMGEYQYKSEFVRDQEINFCAALAEISINGNF